MRERERWWRIGINLGLCLVFALYLRHGGCWLGWSACYSTDDLAQMPEIAVMTTDTIVLEQRAFAYRAYRRYPVHDRYYAEVWLTLGTDAPWETIVASMTHVLGDRGWYLLNFGRSGEVLWLKDRIEIGLFQDSPRAWREDWQAMVVGYPTVYEVVIRERQ